ncbi:MAG TPA: hypothetical protein VEB68_06055 [Croceibacterium sp.]|nr:hypothetical protein [Croceibacterium sp.]
MEYEISDEDRLFDDSTNPSLKHEHAQAIRHQSSVRPQDYPADKRRMQKAELIPEEEEPLA